MEPAGVNLLWSEASERCLLASVLLNPELYPDLAMEVAPTDLYLGAHRRFWEAMSYCWEEHGEIHIPAIKAALERAGKFETGDISLLAGLELELPDTYQAANFAKTVRERSVLRHAVTTARRVIETSATGADLDEVLGTMHRGYLEAESRRAGGGDATHVGDVEVDLDGPPRKGIGIPTGLRDLDKWLLGYPPGHLGLIAGRPSHGKTSLMLSIARHMTLGGAKVLIFSLEMSKPELKLRLLAMHAGVSLTSLLRRDLSGDQRTRVDRASAELAQTSLWVDERCAITFEDIASRCRRHRTRHGLDIAMIDYLGLMRSRERYETEDLRIAHITGSLKGLAKDLAIPVLALHQLSRQPERRSTREPQLDDLRGSGALEQDADSVLFIMNRWKYTREEKDRGLAQLILAKLRNGETGFLEVAFDLPTQKFSDLYQGEVPY